jgi:hypothetical protein
MASLQRSVLPAVSVSALLLRARDAGWRARRRCLVGRRAPRKRSPESSRVARVCAMVLRGQDVVPPAVGGRGCGRRAAGRARGGDERALAFIML